MTVPACHAFSMEGSSQVVLLSGSKPSGLICNRSQLIMAIDQLSTICSVKGVY